MEPQYGLQCNNYSDIILYQANINLEVVVSTTTTTEQQKVEIFNAPTVFQRYERTSKQEDDVVMRSIRYRNLIMTLLIPGFVLLQLQQSRHIGGGSHYCWSLFFGHDDVVPSDKKNDSAAYYGTKGKHQEEEDNGPIFITFCGSQNVALYSSLGQIVVAKQQLKPLVGLGSIQTTTFAGKQTVGAS
jgi:hypothetical protein